LSEEFERTEISGQVRRAVLSLPLRYREVITLCDLEEMDYDQAATLLKCPIGTVRSRLNRAREMLVEKLRVALNAPKPFSSRATGTE
jgi:RNA polymerase sigma-70 factor (ECF subfamily)